MLEIKSSKLELRKEKRNRKILSDDLLKFLNGSNESEIDFSRMTQKRIWEKDIRISLLNEAAIFVQNNKTEQGNYSVKSAAIWTHQMKLLQFHNKQRFNCYSKQWQWKRTDLIHNSKATN